MVVPAAAKASAATNAVEYVNLLLIRRILSTSRRTPSRSVTSLRCCDPVALGEEANESRAASTLNTHATGSDDRDLWFQAGKSGTPRFFGAPDDA
jgi:hypothetical protein